MKADPGLGTANLKSRLPSEAVLVSLTSGVSMAEVTVELALRKAGGSEKPESGTMRFLAMEAVASLGSSGMLRRLLPKVRSE